MQTKFRLDIDDLAVTSFVVSSEGVMRGTVRGHDASEEGTCTTCWGNSADCTNNPAATECAVSAQYCSETDCWVSREEYGNYGCGGGGGDTVALDSCTCPHTCGGVCG